VHGAAVNADQPAGRSRSHGSEDACSLPDEQPGAEQQAEGQGDAAKQPEETAYVAERRRLTHNHTKILKVFVSAQHRLRADQPAAE
jgi:hypothetical protein